MTLRPRAHGHRTYTRTVLHTTNGGTYGARHVCSHVGDSTYGALVNAQHERRLNDVGEGLHLLITEHRLEQREHALCGSRVGRECENDLRTTV